MKANLAVLDGSESFMVHPHQVAGETVLLCQPTHIGAVWTPETLIFRSSVWNLQGEPVSLSFKKFFNWGEQPAICTPPTSLANARLMEKIDGSALIFSRYKGTTVIRTRGTTDARLQENGHEIDYLTQKYSAFMEYFNKFEITNSSFIFEWTSPTNRIVINYGDEPDMFLTGIVYHDTYSYVEQGALDDFAKFYGLRRPATYHYDSIEEMKQAVTDFRGKEGVCVYFHNDQEILKFKGAQYLFLHRAKSEIASIEKVIDLYLDVFFNSGSTLAPTYQEFMDYLTKTFDYEIAQMAVSNVSQICDAMKEVNAILASMLVLVGTVSPLKGVLRRDAAARIFQAYGTTNRTGFAFKLLDGKKLAPDDYKKLLFQTLKQ